ncbi:hypothetical protein P43SY_003096 [Pythium insidiosum]|uniref:Thioredoxin domain-containing protein n=1 Tax=Pythium insidiosum TaxID=114742 RepID=A0AAD5QEF7_PYTIN|nr:hypothetical protein P43SY_003096 [Pythium insidiosum]
MLHRLTTTTRTVGAHALRSTRGFATSRVAIVGSHDAYTKITAPGSGKKAVVYFTAKWCPPCKVISPIFDELSAQFDGIQFAKVDVDEQSETTSRAGVRFDGIQFAKVDVDEQSETTSRAGVRSMPTFFFFDDGKLQRQLSFSGADENLLRENISELNEL